MSTVGLIISLLVGWFILYALYHEWVRIRKIYSAGIMTQAKIIDYEVTERRSDGGVSSTTSGITKYQDSSGREYTGSLPTSDSAIGQKIGQMITIKYDPEEPESFVRTKGRLQFLGMGLGLLFSIGLVSYVIYSFVQKL